MGESTLIGRILGWLSWAAVSIRHRHRMAGMLDCNRCQRDGWLLIADQYPPGSPEAIQAKARADEMGAP